MAPSDVVNSLVTTFADFLSYMTPLIGALAGVIFVVTLLVYVLTRMAPRIFRG